MYQVTAWSKDGRRHSVTWIYTVHELLDYFTYDIRLTEHVRINVDFN